MLRLIREHNLGRFSAVVQAANGWFGLSWDSISVKVVNDTIDRAILFLTDPKTRAKALAGADAEEVHLALWSAAFEDAEESIPIAARLLKHKSVEIRYVAAAHLGSLGLPQTRPASAAAFADEDLRVAWAAFTGSTWSPETNDFYLYDPEQDETPDEHKVSEDYFENLRELIRRVPEKPLALKPLVWPWTEQKASREQVAHAMLDALGERPPTDLIPFLPAMSSWRRRFVVGKLAEQKKWDGLTRETLLRLAGDTSTDVREAVFPVLAKKKLLPAEIETLESYLTRKTNDLRQGVLSLLLGQDDARALASADRLMASGDSARRLGGLEVLRQMAVKKRRRNECQARAEAYRTSRRKLAREEQGQVEAILDAAKGQATLDDALGLLDPAQRSPVVTPKDRKVHFLTPAAVACLRGLDELVNKHRETTIRYKRLGQPRG